MLPEINSVLCGEVRLRHLCIVTKTCTVCLLMLASTTVAACLAQDATEQKTHLASDAEIDRLLDQLQTGSRAQREAAEKALVEVGPGAIERLPAVTDSTSEELRSRLMRIRAVLGQGASAQSSQEASRVTLSGRMKLSAALEALQKQTTNRVVDYRDRYAGTQSDPEVQVDFEEVPYLQALDGILDQAGLKLSLFSGEAGVLAIVNREAGELPSPGRVAYDGPFRVAATRITASYALGNPRDRGLLLGIVVIWEPRAVPMTFRFDPARIEAVYDDGTTATFRENARAFSVPVQEAVAGVELEFPFILPPRKRTKIVSLKGKLTSSLPGGRTKLVFEDLSETQGSPTRVGNLTLAVQRARRDGRLVDIVLVIKFDSVDDPLSTYRGWVFQHPAALVDSQGTQHEYVGLETMVQRDDTLALAYKFEVGAALNKLKLVYDVPSSVTLQELSFELNDIELP